MAAESPESPAPTTCSVVTGVRAPFLSRAEQRHLAPAPASASEQEHADAGESGGEVAELAELHAACQRIAAAELAAEASCDRQRHRRLQRQPSVLERARQGG